MFSWLSIGLGLLKGKAKGLPLQVKLIVMAGLMAVSAAGGWWLSSTIAEAKEAAHLKAVISWYEEQNRKSKARYEEHYRKLEDTKDFYKQQAEQWQNVATPECTDLGEPWRGMFNDLSRRSNAFSAHRSDGR